MEKTIATMEHVYSDLGALQRPYRLEYRLRQAEDAPRFCLQVVRFANGCQTFDVQRYFVCEEGTARSILIWLCENSVSPLVLSDVLTDLRSRGFLAMEPM